MLVQWYDLAMNVLAELVAVHLSFFFSLVSFLGVSFSTPLLLAMHVHLSPCWSSFGADSNRAAQCFFSVSFWRFPLS